MQTMLVTMAAPKCAGGVAQAPGASIDGASLAEGADFSALLLAQIKGGKGLGHGQEKGLEALLDEAMVEPVLPDAVVEPQLINAALPERDDLPVLVLLPVALPVLDDKHPQKPDVHAEDASQQVLAAGFFPAAPMVAQQLAATVSATAEADHLQLGIRRPAGLPDAALEVPVAGVNLPTVAEKVAAFAADGKKLPQESLLAIANEPKLHSFTADTPRAEVAGNTVFQVAVPVNNPAIADAKTLPVPAASLQQAVGSPTWGEALGQKVVWMAGQQTQIAELHLNPPHLGPMEVRLSISNDQIAATFVSHQPAVREAIEAAMPRLREMLAESGMTLGNATVSSDSLPQQQASGRENQPGSSRSSDVSASGMGRGVRDMAGMIPLRRDGSGMVDLFA